MKITKTMTALLLLSSLSFSQISKAEDIELPVIKAPSALMEGTQRDLTAEQVAELLPWAKNSKEFLADLLDNVQGLTAQDKVERLAEGIKNTLLDSSQKNSELLMRYCLTRALVLNDTLSKEMGSDSVGAVDVKLRVLVNSIQLAIGYYDSDMALLSKNTKASFTSFGMTYFSFLSDLNKSVFDASAQYNIQKTALEWLQWDLYRDLNNTSFAPQILKINNILKLSPKSKISDAQAINYVRQMKQMASKLAIEETINSIRLAQEKMELDLRQAPERELARKYPLKVNDRVMFVSENGISLMQTVVSVEENGRYTISYTSDTQDKTYITRDVNRSSLAMGQGCSNGLCVGDNVLIKGYDRVSSIDAILLGNKFLVRSTTLNIHPGENLTKI